jgi:hypothetical protein
MKRTVSRALEVLLNSIFPEPSPPAVGRVPDMAEAAVKAIREWHDAERYFDFVSDPDLVDQSIYTMEACRKRLSYLLGKMRDTPKHGNVY